jgi:AcrR family transcriptional regulator
VSTPGAARRASYGPSSPVVGERGARTRQLLLDAALGQFAERGFHATVVDDIARAAGVSRATLYQYFDSREQIVTELLEECGAALMRVVRRLGPLSASTEGFDNLHWWLGEWSYVYDKYATMFVEWAHIDSPQTPLRPLIVRFVEGYTARLATRIEQADVTGVPADQLAIALVTVIERFNYYRRTRDLGADDAVLLDTLAVAVQLLLFPSTPHSALVHSGDRVSPSTPSQPARAVLVVAVPHQPAAAGDPAGAAPRSVEQLLAAAAEVFSAAGYRGSSVDQVLAVAGLSRRTFYKYFGNRLDLLQELSTRCAGQVRGLAGAFRALPASPDRSAALRAWLQRLVEVDAAHGSMLRTWVEEPVDPQVAADGETSLALLLEAFVDVFSRSPRPPGYDVTAAAWLLLALVERFPHQGVGTRYEVRGHDLVEVMAAFLERGLLTTT